MRALIVYASWFGHNREAAKYIAAQLANHGVHVVCAPITRVTASDVIGCDVLVLGSFTHAHHASWRLRHLIESIPERRLKRLMVAVFGTQTVDERPSSIDDLVGMLGSRGIHLAIPPLRIVLSAPDFAPWSQIVPAERDKIDAFVRSLMRELEPELAVQR